VEDRNFSRRRGLRARACLVAVVAALGGTTVGVPAAAAANVEGGNSFNELSTKAQEQEQENTTSTATTKSETETEAHNSNKTLFIGIGAAIVLLVAIATVIVRDARRVAPAGAEEIGEGRSGRDRVAQHRRRRAKAKAARTQRKKNR
jgi:cytoskeletal protein RodZ